MIQSKIYKNHWRRASQVRFPIVLACFVFFNISGVRLKDSLESERSWKLKIIEIPHMHAYINTQLHHKHFFFSCMNRTIKRKQQTTSILYKEFKFIKKARVTFCYATLKSISFNFAFYNMHSPPLEVDNGNKKKTKKTNKRTRPEGKIASRSPRRKSWS